MKKVIFTSTLLLSVLCVNAIGQELNRKFPVSMSRSYLEKNYLIGYWKSIFHEEFNQQDIQYINQQYPFGFSTEKIILVGEYVGEAEDIEVVPTEDVIIDVVTHHYTNIGTYPTPAYIGEIFAKVYKIDYYKHVSLYSLWYANQLCYDLICHGRFYDFIQNLNRTEYPIIDINTLKHVKTQQDRQICEVINACLDALLENGGLGLEYIFDEYYTFDY